RWLRPPDKRTVCRHGGGSTSARSSPFQTASAAASRRLDEPPPAYSTEIDHAFQRMATTRSNRCRPLVPTDADRTVRVVGTHTLQRARNGSASMRSAHPWTPPFRSFHRSVATLAFVPVFPSTRVIPSWGLWAASRQVV